MEKVSVSRGLLIGVVAVAAASLLAVAFLLGRASGSASPSAPPSGREPAPGGTSVASELHAPEQPPPPRSGAPGTDPEALPAGGASPSATAPRAPLPAAPGSIPAPAAAEPSRAVSDPERAAVAAYLDAVDRIQPGQVSGDAEGVANEMAAALAKGDSSGLDRMIRDAEAAKGKLASLAPPAPCATHHRESLASLDDALEMLRSLKAAMESPDPVAQLAGIASRATAVRSRAEGLQREELALRQRYGLAR